MKKRTFSKMCVLIRQKEKRRKNENYVEVFAWPGIGPKRTQECPKAGIEAEFAIVGSIS